MDNVYIITIKYSDELNDHTSVVETYYPSVQMANQVAWGIFDQYLDDLVEYWDKRGDEDKTNRYTRFIREIKELKTKPTLMSLIPKKMQNRDYSSLILGEVN